MMTATSVCTDFLAKVTLLANRGSGVVLTVSRHARSMTAKDELGMVLMAAATKVCPRRRT